MRLKEAMSAVNSSSPDGEVHAHAALARGDALRALRHQAQRRRDAAGEVEGEPDRAEEDEQGGEEVEREVDGLDGLAEALRLAELRVALLHLARLRGHRRRAGSVETTTAPRHRARRRPRTGTATRTSSPPAKGTVASPRGPARAASARASADGGVAGRGREARVDHRQELALRGEDVDHVELQLARPHLDRAAQPALRRRRRAGRAPPISRASARAWMRLRSGPTSRERRCPAPASDERMRSTSTLNQRSTVCWMRSLPTTMSRRAGRHRHQQEDEDEPHAEARPEHAAAALHAPRGRGCGRARTARTRRRVRLRTVRP